MRTNQGNVLRSLTNMKTFLDEHAAKLGGVVTTGVRKQLDNAIAELSVQATDQAKHTITGRQFTQTQRALRSELMEHHMQPIVRIARLSLPDTPEMIPLRSLPRQGTSPAIRSEATQEPRRPACRSNSARAAKRAWALSLGLLAEARARAMARARTHARSSPRA